MKAQEWLDIMKQADDINQRWKNLTMMKKQNHTILIINNMGYFEKYNDFALYRKISQYGVYQHFVRHYFKSRTMPEIKTELKTSFKRTWIIIKDFGIEIKIKNANPVKEARGYANRQFILQNYRSMTAGQIAAELNISRENVLGYCKRLGIKTKKIKYVREKKIKNDLGIIDRTKFSNYSNHSPYGIADSLRT